MKLNRWLTRALGSFRGSDGRTLIELLVAMAIASMVTIALASIVILGLRFSTHDRYEDQRIYPVRNGFDMIVSEVRTATATYPNCPTGSSRTALAIRQSDGSIGYVTYHQDATPGPVVRTLYKNHNCTGTATASNVAYQITFFDLSALSGGRFSIEMRAQSTNGEEFRLTQRVTGRVLGQP